MRTIRPVNFRTYLGWLVAAVLLPVIGLSAYLSLLSAESERTSLEHGIRETARALSLAVDGQVAVAKSILDALAANSSLKAGDYRTFRSEAEEFLKDHDGWISIVDETGQQHINTKVPRDAPLPRTDNREWLHNIFGARPYYVTNAITGPVVKEAFVAISRRISISGSTPMVITLALAPETLSRVLLEQGMPSGWYGVIADRGGVIIGRTQSKNLIGRPMTIRTAPPGGFVRARTWEGEPVYIGWSTSNVTGWSTGVAAPAAIFDNLLLYAWIKIGSLAILSIALALTAALYVGRLLTKPLGDLVTEVLSDSPQKLANRAPIKEFNTLALAFRTKVSELIAAAQARDSAQAELSQLNRELEQRVQSRMAEIELLGERLFQLQKQESIGRLTGGIAHDFNNLLTAVIGNLELLAKRRADHPALRFVTNAQQAARRGAELTAQLLAFSRKQNLDPKPLDVNASVRAMAEMFRSTLGGTIRIETQLAPEPLPALADQTQLDLILLNLAINARDAMPAGGLLTIETNFRTLDTVEQTPEAPPPGDYVVIAVSDTGTGMSEEVRSQIFEPYFTTKPLGKGSGLGLPHVLGVTKQSGGGLRIRSNPDLGTTVEVYLPRCRDAAAEMPSAPPHAPNTFKQTRVLLVDDDPDVRAVAANMLRELGCFVVEVGNGDAAIERVRKQEDIFDAAVIDYAMPGKNGAEAANEIRSINPDISILIMTGYADAQRLSELWQGPLLKKPFDLLQLSNSLSGIVAENPTVVHLRMRSKGVLSSGRT